MQWEEIFQEHILDRGFDYYQRDLLQQVTLTKNQAEAEVYGSSKYHVKMTYQPKDQKITELSCDCPHFLSGNYCKHLAALLFYLENHFDHFQQLNASIPLLYPQEEEVAEEETEDVEALVYEAHEKAVREFLIDVLEENYILRDQFKGLLGQEITEQDLKAYQRTIDEIFIAHGSGADDFIYYYDAIEFEADLGSFMEEIIVDVLLKNYFYEAAFKLTNQIFMKITTQPMDDSAGVIVGVVTMCQNYWREMATKGSNTLKDEMYHWFKEQLTDPALADMSEYIEEILFNAFMEEPYLMDKKTFAKQKFKETKAKNDYWSQRMHVSHWAERYLDTLEILNDDLEEWLEFCQNNLQYAQVRERYVDYCIDQKELEQAIRLLEEGQEVPKKAEHAEISRAYKMKLKDLYKETGQTENYIKQLWSLMIDRCTIDQDLYAEYRALYAKEDWEEEKMNVLKKLSIATNIAELYAEEGLYDLLLKNVTIFHSLSYLQKYEKLLMKYYPEEVFKRYEKEVWNLAEETGSRKKYRKIVSILRRMRRLPNDKSSERVSKLAKKLQETYKNRPAMLDELRQL